MTKDIPYPQLRQRWRPKGDEGASSWIVVSIDEHGVVGLSGPGPCRSMHYETAKFLRANWELVP